MKQHHIIQTVEDLEELDRYLEDYAGEPLALDTETEGLFYFAREIGICISVDPEIGFYIPSRLWNGSQLTDTPLRPLLKPYFEKWFIKKKRHLIFHNYAFDCRIMLNNFGIDLIDEILADTILMFKMCVSEDDPAGLKELGVRYLGEDAADEQVDLKDSVIKNGGKWLKEEKQFFRSDLAPLARYGAKDPCMTLALYNIFNPILQADAQLKTLWETETLPLMRVIFKMNTTPFHVDIPYFEKLRIDMGKDIDDLETKVLVDIAPLIKDYEKELIHFKTKIARHPEAKRLALAQGFNMKALTDDQARMLKEAVYRHDYGVKTPFKLTSSKDLRWLIYDKLKEPVTKKTDKGAPSTDGDVIEELSKKYTWASLLLEKKQLEKLLNTYVEGVFKHHINGVVYFEFNQGGTISGRFSTKGGIPIMTLPKTRTDIKQGFIAPKGYKLIAADANSLEPHIAAYLSKDPELIDAFVSGKDFYSVIGIKQFGIKDATPYKDGSSNSFAKKYADLRDRVKIFALALIYGAEDHRISEVLHPEAVDWKTRQIYKKEAQDLIDGYFRAFPGIKRLIDESHKEAHINGQVRTKFGRIRHMPLVQQVYKDHGFKLKDHKYAKDKGLLQLRREYKNLLNNSTNIQVQGLGAHIMNNAAIKINGEFQKLGLNAWISAQIHDELICTVREDQAEQVLKVMKECISSAVDLSPIVIKSEGKIGNNLKETK